MVHRSRRSFETRRPRPHVSLRQHDALSAVSLIMRESYNTPERVYRLRQGPRHGPRRDHRSRYDFRRAHARAIGRMSIIGCEVSATFPRTGTDVHLEGAGHHAEPVRRNRSVAARRRGTAAVSKRESGSSPASTMSPHSVNGQVTRGTYGLADAVDRRVRSPQRIATADPEPHRDGARAKPAANRHRRQRFAYRPRHRLHVYGRGSARRRAKSS